eukprot:1157973-Pelagomonas_calceolata.AAC.3
MHLQSIARCVRQTLQGPLGRGAAEAQQALGPAMGRDHYYCRPQQQQQQQSVAGQLPQQLPPAAAAAGPCSQLTAPHSSVAAGPLPQRLMQQHGGCHFLNPAAEAAAHAAAAAVEGLRHSLAKSAAPALQRLLPPQFPPPVPRLRYHQQQAPAHPAPAPSSPAAHGLLAGGDDDAVLVRHAPSIGQLYGPGAGVADVAACAAHLQHPYI